MEKLRIKEILEKGLAGEEIQVSAWVRTKRESKAVNFVALNDGSTIHNFQVVVEVEKFMSLVLLE